MAVAPPPPPSSSPLLTPPHRPSSPLLACCGNGHQHLYSHCLLVLSPSLLRPCCTMSEILALSLQIAICGLSGCYLDAIWMLPED